MIVSVEAGATAIVILAALACLLGVVVLRRYLAHRQTFQLAFAAGLFLVAFTLVQEAIFYVGYWSEWMISSYLFLVALLVGVLSLGSAELGLGRVARRIYTAYVALGCALVAWAVLATTIPQSILDGGVVTGNPPLAVIVTSSLVTFPATALMIGVSILGAVRQKRWQLLYVAAGIVVVTVAGTLYIASIPVTLYVAEFVGVFLLFLGFIRLPLPTRAPAPAGAAPVK